MLDVKVRISIQDHPVSGAESWSKFDGKWTESRRCGLALYLRARAHNFQNRCRHVRNEDPELLGHVRGAEGGQVTRERRDGFCRVLVAACR